MDVLRCVHCDWTDSDSPAGDIPRCDVCKALERLEATIRRAQLAEDELDERMEALTAIQGLTEILRLLILPPSRESRCQPVARLS